MQQPNYFIGVDISSDTFTVSVGTSPWKLIGSTLSFENSACGFEEFLIWLDKQDITNQNSVICMESTGVYGQGLAYFLFSHNYTVSVEPPLKVKKAFPTHGNKNDITDSKHIAEYACRYYDELHIWKPPQSVLEQVQTLLKTREQLTKSSVSYQNTLKTLRRQSVRTPFAEDTYKELIEEIKTVIKKIDKEIKDLFEKHPFFNHRFANLLSIPCVGVQLAGYVLVSLYKKDKDPRARSLASYVGICPYEHESGTSVRNKPRSRKNGSSSIRKLLYLAAMSLRTHNTMFKEYYIRKTQSGKPGRLVLNNIQNRLIRIMCGVLNSGKPYIDGYLSVNPGLLNNKICA